MKKSILFLLTITLLLALTACVTTTCKDPPLPPDASAYEPEDAVVPKDEPEPEDEVEPKDEVVPEPEKDFWEGRLRSGASVDNLEQLSHYIDNCLEYEAVYYFLRSDSRSLEKLFFGEGKAGLFAALESLRFSSFCLSVNEQNLATLDFTVSQSTWDRFPVGDYSYTLQTLASDMWEDNNLTSMSEQYTLPWRIARTGCVDDFVFERGVLDVDYDYTIFVSLLKAEIYLGTSHNGITLERAREGAKALFDIEDYVPQIGKTCNPLPEAEDRYMTRTYGANVVTTQFTDITDDGTNLTFLCRTYADPMYLIPVGVYEYRFARADNEYGWTLMGVSRLAKNDLEPWDFST